MAEPFTTIYDKIWALLEANTYVNDTVKPANRIKLTGPAAVPEKSSKKDADFPELDLKFGRRVYSGYTLAPRYSFRTGVPAGTPKQLVQFYVLTLTHRDLRAVANDPLEAAVVDALHAAGPSMGLVPASFPYVFLGEISADPLIGSTDESGRALRTQTTITIPVTVRFVGAPLTS